jgi:hypothetical protein
VRSSDFRMCSAGYKRMASDGRDKFVVDSGALILYPYSRIEMSN